MTFRASDIIPFSFAHLLVMRKRTTLYFDVALSEFQSLFWIIDGCRIFPSKWIKWHYLPAVQEYAERFGLFHEAMKHKPEMSLALGKSQIYHFCAFGDIT